MLQYPGRQHEISHNSRASNDVAVESHGRPILSTSHPPAPRKRRLARLGNLAPLVIGRRKPSI